MNKLKRDGIDVQYQYQVTEDIMRDYSFGNYISTLRERMGLSQYQLGVLVGVSDKAVSKWENGASKPRINTIKKLSRIFDVSVDELLTCEYGTFTGERKDLFTMKKDIVKLAENKMRELYGDKIPLFILNRFKMEKIILAESDELLWIGFFGFLQEKMKDKDYYFEIRDSQIQASLLAWLLGATEVNPLPAHYYCPHCKKIEFFPDKGCGLDLLEKMCKCGTKFKRDGFGIDVMNMYPLSKWNEIHISKKAEKLVTDCIEEYFAGTGVLQKLLVENSDDKDEISRFVIVLYGMNNKSATNRVHDWRELCQIMSEHSGITIVTNEREDIGNIREADMDLAQEQINEYYQFAINNDEFVSFNSKINLDCIYQNIRKPKYSDLIDILGLTKGTDTWNDNGEVLYKSGKKLDELITNREDVYSYLYRKMNAKCCDNPSGQVYEIKENLRKGKYTSGRMPKEIEELLVEADVPEWYIDSMKKIRYLFPKTNLIMQLKKKMIMYFNNKDKQIQKSK